MWALIGYICHVNVHTVLCIAGVSTALNIETGKSNKWANCVVQSLLNLRVLKEIQHDSKVSNCYSILILLALLPVLSTT